jgi:putative phosphoribosyl transferase
MGNLSIVSHSSQPFTNRAEAGRLLGRQLQSMGMAPENMVVLGIPRGGIVVAKEIARAIDADLDIVLSRKLGAPGNPELAIGAVAEDGKVFLQQRVVENLRVSDNYIREEKIRQMTEIARRSELIRRILPRIPLAGRDIIVTDDGIATGATMQAALWVVTQERPSRLICAVPVGPEDTLMDMAKDADDVLCLRSPPGFAAVGQFYRFFPQTEDEEVFAIMQEEAGRKGITGEIPRPG